MGSLKTAERPVCIDLFAGAGGLSLGFEQAGFDVAAAVEIDPIHCAVHEYNFPRSASICASVTDTSGASIRERANLLDCDIDVIVGGAPCQGFSLIGKRVLDDPRNSLVTHYIRIVRELRPRYFVFENVKGLTIGKHRRLLDEFLASVEAAGYDVIMPYQVLNAANYGVPQSRHRLILVGARRGEVLPEYPAPQGRTTVAEAIEDLPDADQFDELVGSDSVQTSWMTRSEYARRLRCLLDDPQDFGYRRIFNKDLLTSSLRTKHTQLSQARFAATENGKTEPVSRFRKLAPDGLCNTLRAGTDSARGAFTSPRPIHPTLPRVITVREAARLHSYPDWFRFHTTKWHGFRQVGNSVPPLLARAVGSVLMKAMKSTPAKPTEALALGPDDLLSFDMGKAAAYYGVPRTVIAQRTRKQPPATADGRGAAYV